MAAALPSSAAAQAFDWRPVNHQTATLIKAGHFEEAAPLVDSALARCRQAANLLQTGLCTAIFDENRSTVLESRGDLRGAETALRACIEARNAVLPDNHPLMLEAHDWMAQFYRRHNLRSDEVRELLQTEAIARANGPEKATVLGVLMNTRARALAALGKDAEAVAAYREGYETVRQADGATSINALTTLANLVGALVDAGSADAAMDMARTALLAPDAAAFDPTLRARLAGQLALAVQNEAQA